MNAAGMTWPGADWRAADGTLQVSFDDEEDRGLPIACFRHGGRTVRIWDRDIFNALMRSSSPMGERLREYVAEVAP